MSCQIVYSVTGDYDEVILAADRLSLLLLQRKLCRRTRRHSFSYYYYSYSTLYYRKECTEYITKAVYSALFRAV